MKGSMRAATAIGVGYLLGRRRKLRTATFMAVATAVGGTTLGGMMLKRGMKMLNNSEALGKIAPQLTEITDVVRGDLLTAGKAAGLRSCSARSCRESVSESTRLLTAAVAAAFPAVSRSPRTTSVISVT